MEVHYYEGKKLAWPFFREKSSFSKMGTNVVFSGSYGPKWALQQGGGLSLDLECEIIIAMIMLLVHDDLFWEKNMKSGWVDWHSYAFRAATVTLSAECCQFA